MATHTALDKADLAYYAQQQQAVNNTQAIGLEEQRNAQAGADLTYAQKMQALQEKLSQQQAALPDKFAARGIQNSGIYNYGGGNAQYTGSLGSGWNAYRGVPGGQLGALQQFKQDAATSMNDIRNQQENVDQGYQLKTQDLNNTAQNQRNSISVTQAAQQAAQAAADAIGAA